MPNAHTESLADSKVVYLLGADQLSAADIPSDAFVIYQGHHGDVGANLADVILPGCAYTEKNATFVNTEGRAQMTRAAVSAPGSAREDWAIVRALSEVVGKTLPYDDVHTLRERMAEIAPHLGRYGVAERGAFPTLGLAAMETLTTGAAPPKKRGSKKAVATVAGPFTAPIADFYLTDVISRSSPTMAKCSMAYTKPKLAQQQQHASA